MAVTREPDDEIPFAEEESPGVAGRAAAGVPGSLPWTVLIVDDEPEVHSVTRLALADFRFRDRPLRFLSAYSGGEARALLDREKGIAVILLDVVMETDHAGLDLVRHIRERLSDRIVRIVLRTGQPGRAPERRVIVDYDINDYKEKSDLTAPRLFSAMVTALRSFEDLMTIETNRRGLERIIAASASLFRTGSMDRFIEGVRARLADLLDLDGESFVAVRRTSGSGQETRIVAGNGRFARLCGRPLAELPEAHVRDAIEAATHGNDPLTINDLTVVRFRGETDHEGLACFDRPAQIGDVDERLIEIFCGNAAIGLDNAFLYEQLRRSEAATVFALAKAAEFKDDNTADHLRRVSVYCRVLAQVLYERGAFRSVIDEKFLQLIGLASVLHDVGKVGVPDRILQKPEQLDADEWQIMREHARMSEEILKEPARMIEGETYLSLGSELAGAHHERFDGTGYPRHLAGDSIPVSARIMAVVDVFDALTTVRPYKKAWTVERALTLIEDEAGKQFDPVVVDAFLFAIRSGRIQPGCPDLETALPLPGWTLPPARAAGP
jgi:response regulator RpfG family c-di-GMP phosphodiesterase